MLTYFVYAPLLVLVFLGSCRLLFGKSPLCKQKSNVQDVQPSTTSVVLFLCQAVRVLLTYFVYAPLRMLAFRDFRRLLCVCLSLVVRLWRGAHVLRVRSAPRPRLSWLLPFALWQVTSLQAKKQCSRRTTKHNFGCAFFFVRLWARCSRTFVRSAPCPRLPRLVRLAPRLVNVWQEITTPLRMLAFRDFQRLLCARLSLCFKHAPLLVLVFLGSCRLLFGKSPLCKQKSSVQDVQQKHGDLPCFLI